MHAQMTVDGCYAQVEMLNVEEMIKNGLLAVPYFKMR